MKNGAYGSRSHGGYRSNRDEMNKYGRILDTPDKRGDGHMFYSSSNYDMHYDHHHYHTYRSGDRGYFPDEFKKVKPHIFYGYFKNPEDEEAWLLGMNKFFKTGINIFNLKGKADIWREDVKQVRNIRIEDLSWPEFKRIFRKKYLSERCYDNKAKEFYELNMGSMIDEEYTTMFLDLLRHVPYLKYEKAKVRIFFSGFKLAFRDQIEYDEPKSLDEVIVKLKHRYEKPKPKTKSLQGLKGKDKPKGKW